MWRRISLWHVNLVLLLLAAAIAAPYWRELRWAARTMPDYVEGSIGSLPERELYRQAAELIREGDELERARGMLERSISIDPNAEGPYWLARYHFEKGQDEEALKLFRAYLEIDPTMTDAYLKSAAILERSGRPEEAELVLQTGLDYFAGNQERYEPRYDPEVYRSFYKKADWVHFHYRRSAQTLRRELDALRERGASAATPRGR